MNRCSVDFVSIRMEVSKTSTRYRRLACLLLSSSVGGCSLCPLIGVIVAKGHCSTRCSIALLHREADMHGKRQISTKGIHRILKKYFKGPI